MLANDAFAYLQSVLDLYGLGSLHDWAWQQIQAGSSDDEVIQNLRQRPEYAARFPGMAERKTRGLPAISPNEYIATERQYGQMMRNAGLPTGFYDQASDFAQWIGRDVSVAEAAQRVKLAEDASFSWPQDVRDELMNLYGFSQGDLTALAIDPDTAVPLLTRRWQAAEVSGAARRTGYGGLTVTEGEGLAALGVGQEQAQQGFNQLAGQKELFSPLDAGEGAIGREDQLGATFGGNADAQTKIQNRSKRRTAEFAQGGGFQTGQQGYVGVG